MYGHDELFSFSNVTGKDVFDGIKSGAVGLDGIQISFLRLLLPSILPCITHMFTMSQRYLTQVSCRSIDYFLSTFERFLLDSPAIHRKIL
jgi:hypothetical protein